MNVAAEVAGAEISFGGKLLLAFSEAQGNSAGKVEMTGKFKVSVALPSDSAAAHAPVNFTADARCGGSWTPEEEMITTISFLRSITTPSPLLSTRILSSAGANLSPEQLDNR